MIGTRIPSMKNTIREKYINENYNNQGLKSTSELVDNGNLKEIYVEDLPNTVIEGAACSSYRKTNGKLYFAYTDNNSHTIINGSTGSGKTCGFVDNNIYFLSTKKNKANLFITDPKGELLSKHAKRLEKAGYNIYLLNFIDSCHSNSWNMLSEIYDLNQKQNNLTLQIKHHSDLSDLSNYAYGTQTVNFNVLKGFWSYENFAFDSESEAKKYVSSLQTSLKNEISDMIAQISLSLIPEEMLAKNDPSWMMGARTILESLIYLLLEDSVYDGSELTRSCFNLSTISDYYNIIRQQCINTGSNSISPLLQSKVLNHKSINDTSIKGLITYFENAPTTSRSYLGCFDNAMRKFLNAKYYTLCSETTIDVDDDKKPFAIFISTRDYEKSDYQIAALFIEYIYRKMVEKAANNPAELRETHFILDEFANIPAITSFDSKISTSRSRNIWFNMIVQSYAQIDMKYGCENATNINDNVNQHYFLGSTNYSTIQRFSKECGNVVMPSLDNVLNLTSNSTIELPIVPINKLQNIKAGDYYGRIKSLPVIYGHFEQSYLCPELETNNTTTPIELGFRSNLYDDSKYVYHYLHSNKTMQQYAKENIESKEEAFVNIASLMEKLNNA